MRTPKYCFILLLVMFLLAGSCKKEPVNPYDQVNLPTQDTVETQEPAPASIASLHAKVFRPTCANSGCHDGSFEPDFRTLGSTYSSLVYQPIIKNDPDGTYEYRVVPGQPAQSLLLARLTSDIDGMSGIMPLIIEPDSDWPEQKDTYIDNIRQWIAEGAKDVFGNTTVPGNTQPQLLGVAARGSNWLKRLDSGEGAIKVSTNETDIVLYFAIEDDEQQPTELTENRIRFAAAKNSFANSTDYPLEVLSDGVIYTGHSGSEVSYHHKIMIKPQDFAAPGETLYFRIYVKDQDNPVTEIPADGSADHLKVYCSMSLVQ
ncbi:MAG: hypothetical protein AAGG75_20050 [Bacteroidota bacterium]